MGTLDKRGKGKVTFSYERSPGYRNIHASGIYGGATIQGDIYLAIFVDKPALPISSTLQLDEHNRSMPPESFNASRAPVREVEVGIVMDVALAKSTIDWLQDKINSIEEAQKVALAEPTKK